MDRQAILSAAQSLSDDDRLMLIDDLIASLDEDADYVPNPQFVAELHRRSQELKDFPERSRPAELVLQRLEQRFGSGVVR